MSEEKNKISSDYAYVPGKKRKFPLASFVVLFLVVVGFCIGGYYVHKGFSKGKSNAVAPQAPVLEQVNIEAAGSSPAPATQDVATSQAFASQAQDTQPVVNVPSVPEGNADSSAESATPQTHEQAPESQQPVASSADAGAVAVSADKPASESGAEDEPVAKSDPVSNIRTADSLYAAGDFGMAREKLEGVLANLNTSGSTDLNLKNSVYYRLGLVCRQLKDEKNAQYNWSKAYEGAPNTMYGRLSALALADTWYYWYVQSDKRYDQWEKIRNAYSAVIGMDGARFVDRKTNQRVAERLMTLNEKLIFDPKMKTTGAVFHTVKQGEYVSSIARKYNLGTWTSIPLLNKIDPKRLRAGMTLKIMPGQLFVLVDKKNFTLDWYLDGVFIKRYGCAVGAPETETPAGHYTIFKMDVEPTWTDPKTGKLIKFGQPGHLIGSRWLAMRGGSKNGLGIHGTIDPASIGTKASNGCVRLLNKDVEEMYGFASIEQGNSSEVLVIE